MCEAASIIMGVTAIVGTVVNVIGEKKKADANQEYRNKVSQAAFDNYIQQTKALNNRMAEEREATGQQKEQIRIRNMQAKAEAQASSASSGVTGLSIMNLYQGYARATARSNYVLSRNLNLKGLQSEEEKISYRNQYLSTINTLPEYEPNYLGTILGGIGKAAGGFAGGLGK